MAIVGMTTDRGYLAAVLLGLVAAALVLWQLESSESTACFRDSVELSITGSETVLEDCESESFDAVRDYVAAQRSSAAAGNAVEDPDEVEGRSALIVWMALFAATAGFAAIVAVRSVVMIKDLMPSWTAGLIARCAGAAILLVLPFALFRSIPARLTAFDDLHRAQLMWIPPLIGSLMLPAITALVVIWWISRYEMI